MPHPPLATRRPPATSLRPCSLAASVEFPPLRRGSRHGSAAGGRQLLPSARLGSGLLVPLPLSCSLELMSAWMLGKVSLSTWKLGKPVRTILIQKPTLLSQQVSNYFSCAKSCPKAAKLKRDITGATGDDDVAHVMAELKSPIEKWNQHVSRLTRLARTSMAYDPQPDYSTFREASYGHSILQVKNRTHAVYQWNRNE